MERYQTKRSLLIYVICLYFVGTAIYVFTRTLWSASILMLFGVIGFQSLKLLAGITLFIRHLIAPYLFSGVLVWEIIATGIGFLYGPYIEQTTLSILLITMSTLLLLIIVIYTFYLKHKGYYIERENKDIGG